MQNVHMAMPMAQNYNIIFQVPTSDQPETYFLVIDPTLAILPNGKYLATVPVYRGQKQPFKKRAL